MKVLIADDEQVSRAVLTAVVSRAGYEIVVVERGDAALATLRLTGGPQIAVLDWIMPGVSGVDVCRAVRADTSARYRYLIILTARDGRAERLEGMAAGADDFLTKPIDQAELLARLRSGERVIRLENALADRVNELRQALSQVRQLEGIITICMHCKRIATGTDGWQKLEAYLAAHSNASFTHGLCQQCLDQHFPEGDGTKG
ncbi:MAG: response regulator transcription factor [Deltaproteobacteria bacterium]|nr:response regulator transcription factor [Deltaproteobacteria bacterium]